MKDKLKTLARKMHHVKNAPMFLRAKAKEHIFFGRVGIVIQLTHYPSTKKKRGITIPKNFYLFNG
jgi:hypothetical protein